MENPDLMYGNGIVLTPKFIEGLVGTKRIDFIPYTNEHLAIDGLAPDLIGNRPLLYKKYIQNLSELMAIKFNTHTYFVDYNLFDFLANWASGQNPSGTIKSLIGITNYEIAKRLNKNTFYIPFATGLPFVQDILSHQNHIDNTIQYLNFNGLKFKIQVYYEQNYRPITIGSEVGQIVLEKGQYKGVKFTIE